MGHVRLTSQPRTWLDIMEMGLMYVDNEEVAVEVEGEVLGREETETEIHLLMVQ